MKTRSLNPFVIITLLAITILTVNGYQMKVAFSQDEETPDFGGTKAPFTPLPEDDRNPPPPPSNATKVNELPKSLLSKKMTQIPNHWLLPIKLNFSKFFQPMRQMPLNLLIHR